MLLLILLTGESDYLEKDEKRRKEHSTQKVGNNPFARLQNDLTKVFIIT